MQRHQTPEGTPKWDHTAKSRKHPTESRNLSPLRIPAANSSPQRLLPVGSTDAGRAARCQGRRPGTGERSRQRHRGRERAWERGPQRRSSRKGRAGLGSRLRPESPMRASAPRRLSRLTRPPAPLSRPPPAACPTLRFPPASVGPGLPSLPLRSPLSATPHGSAAVEALRPELAGGRAADSHEGGCSREVLGHGRAVLGACETFLGEAL